MITGVITVTGSELAFALAARNTHCLYSILLSKADSVGYITTYLLVVLIANKADRQLNLLNR